MYKNFKIICCTAAGRRRYMQYLLPYIISEPLIDRYDIWVNTTDNCDIEFFKMMANQYPKIHLVWQPDGIVNGIASINKFYTLCTEKDSIYIKIDDDIVWMEPDIFQKILAFRLNNPEAFLVSPMVVNNAICTYLWQVTNKLDLEKYRNALANHRILWKSGVFALTLHQWFLDKLNHHYSSYKALHIGRRPIANNRFSINFIVWFGDEFASFGGIVPGDDEEYLSVIKPAQIGKYNLFDGDSLIAHFAFHPQREILDQAHILEQYGQVLEKEFSEDQEKSHIFNFIQECCTYIQKHKAEIQEKQCPYPTPTVKKKVWIKRNFKRLQRHIRYLIEKRKGYRITDLTNPTHS